jgi:hypothetical protein
MKLGIQCLVLAAMLALALQPVRAQDRPADHLQILSEKIRIDRKLVVAANMNLTEVEARRFWPVYDAYQKDLLKIDQRLLWLIEAYAADYNNDSINDSKASQLSDEMLSVQEAEVQLMRTYVPKLGAVLPATKVARYLQIENRIRAILKYEIADRVPLMP